MGASRDILTIEVPLGDESKQEHLKVGLVDLETMVVVFHDKRFRELTLRGRLNRAPDIQVSKTYRKVSDVPEWAVPWTVYLADQIAG